MTIPWWILSIISNAAIITTEYMNRIQPTQLEALRYTWLLILIAQTCLYYSYNGAPSLMGAWVMFTIGNSTMRLAMAGTILGEPLKIHWALLACVLMISGAYCIKLATSK